MANCKVYVYEDLGNKDYIKYENVKAGLGPECSLIVTEIVPDVSGKSEAGMKEEVVALYAPGVWWRVEYE